MGTNNQTLREHNVKTYAYLRTSTDKQDLDSQRLAIFEYARQHDLRVDEFVEIAISSRKTPKQRRIDELMEKLESADTLIVSELSRLGRSIEEVVAIVNALVRRKIRLIAIKQSLDIKDGHDMTSKVMVAMFSLFAELERDLISQRTKEGLAAKRKKGVRLGKPPGTLQKSKFDKDRKKIEELLGYGVSVRKIAEVLNYSSHRGLNTYINKRIKKQA